jgi:hypothetical protein
MNRRLLLLLALVWVPFLSIFVFAAPFWGGDSVPHVVFHVVALALIGWGCRTSWEVRGAESRRVPRILAGVLGVTLALALVGHAAELVSAVVRFAEDGWANAETPDLFEEGPHVWAANLTIPMMMLSMLAVLALIVTDALQRRRHLEVAD